MLMANEIMVILKARSDRSERQTVAGHPRVVKNVDVKCELCKHD